MTQTETPTAEAGMTTADAECQRIENEAHEAVERFNTKGMRAEAMTSQGVALGASKCRRAIAALAASTAPRAPAAVPEELRTAFALASDEPLFVHDFADPRVSSEPGPQDIHLSFSHPDHITAASMGNGIEGTILAAKRNAIAMAAAWNYVRTLAAAPAAPPADGGTIAWELAEERKRADLFVALANQLEAALEPFDKFSDTSFADGELCTIRVYARELRAVRAALSARPPAGAAGDPVERRPWTANDAMRSATPEMLARFDADLRDMKDGPRPASPAPTPSPESTLSPAQVATSDGGGEQEALRYAESLTRALYDKHWKVDAPEWQPLAGDLIGMLTQIDNMTAGLSRATTPASAGEGDPVGEDAAYEAAWNEYRWMGGPGYTDSSASTAFLEGWNAALARHQAPAVDVPAERDIENQKYFLTSAESAAEWYTARLADGDWYPTRPDIEAARNCILYSARAGRKLAILATRPTDPGGARGWDLRWCINEIADAAFAINSSAPSEEQIGRLHTAAEALLNYRDTVSQSADRGIA